MPRVYARINFFILRGLCSHIKCIKIKVREVLAIRAELAVAIALIGTIIGAGFASGQELVQFFLTLGPRAPAAIILMGLLLGLTAGQVRLLALKRGTASYHDFLAVLLGNWCRPADIAIASFLFGGLVIMLAGSGALARQYFGVMPLTGVLACGGLALVASLGKGRGILTLNTLLVPVMLAIMIIIAAMYHLESIDSVLPIPDAGSLTSSNWILNAFLYVAYNMVGGMVLLTSLPGSRQGVLGAMLGGLLLGILAYFLVNALAQLSPDDLSLELPLLQLVAISCPGLINLYALALWLAMVTTASSQLYGLAVRLGQIPFLTTWRSAVAILILAFLLATFGFASLVSWLYPLFGYLGLILIILSIGRYLARNYI